MNGLIKNVGASITRIGSKMLFKAKKMSPELLLGGGALLIITGAVLACTHTKQAEEAIDDCEAKLAMFKEAAVDQEITDEDYAKYIRQAKLKMVGRVIQAYSIPAACMATGMAFIFSSHGIMKKRNGAMLAAYNALDAAFQKYRERVRAEDGGLELDRKYMLGDDAYPREADDNLNENEIYDVNKKGLKMAHSNPYGPYTFEFSKYTSPKWSSHAMSNLHTIRFVEDWANRQLRFYGHVFVNEVLKQLDMDDVPWGQLVGWIRGDDDGDGKVHLLALEDEKNLEMDDDGWKSPIFIEMNCDGAIWDRI